MIKELPSFLPRNFQARLIEDFMYSACERYAISVTRRGGKDFIALAISDIVCQTRSGSNVAYLGVSLKSVKKILFSNDASGRPMLESVIDAKALKKTRNGNYFHKDLSCIKYKNGSILYIIGTDQNAELGTSLNLLVITEASRIPFSTWRFLEPSVSGVNGSIIQVSTPYFGSEFNDLLDGEHLKSKVYKKYIIPATELLEADGTRVYSDKKLEKISAEMDRASFQQDYMCNTKAINSTSVMGESLEIAQVSLLPTVTPDYTINSLNGLKMTCAFDLGNDDSCVVTVAIQDHTTKPIIIDYMMENRTDLEVFARWIKERAESFKVKPENVDIVLPFDADQTFQGYSGKINRYQEFRKNMPDYNVQLVGRVDKMRKMQVSRKVLENGDLLLGGYKDEQGNIHHSDKIKAWIKDLSSIEYKTVTSTNKIVYEIDKRSGVGDHILDSFSYLVTWKFRYLFQQDISDIALEKVEKDYSELWRDSEEKMW